MPIVQCRECRKEVATDARACPHCGTAKPAKAKTSSSPWVLLSGYIAIIVVALLWYVGGTTTPTTPPTRPSSIGREEMIRNELRYLTQDIPGVVSGRVNEIAWIDVSSNNVYIGFSSRPNDMSLIIRGAALRCNRAINFSCHVWAIPATSSRPWRGGDGPFYEEVTARNGAIQ